MITNYAVIRLVPDPLKGEFMNVGLIAADGDHARCHFVDSWKILDSFGAERLPYLKEFVRDLNERCDQEDGVTLNSDSVLKLIESWTGFIQFSDARSTTLTVEQSLEQLAPVFLRQPPPVKSRPRDKRAAVRVAKDVFQNALLELELTDAFTVSTEEVIAGRVKEHIFDVTLVNHVPRIGLSGISLELRTHDQILADVDRIAYKMLDTRIEHNDLGLAVLSVGGDQESDQWESLLSMCNNLHAELVSEEAAGGWAIERLKALV